MIVFNNTTIIVIVSIDSNYIIAYKLIVYKPFVGFINLLVLRTGHWKNDSLFDLTYL